MPLAVQPALTDAAVCRREIVAMDITVLDVSIRLASSVCMKVDRGVAIAAINARARSPKNQLSQMDPGSKRSYAPSTPYQKRITILAARRTLAVLAVLSAVMLVPGAARSQSPLNIQGQVGLTSYTMLPFSSAVYQLSWGSTAGLAPMNLFWRDGSHFNDKITMTNALEAAKNLTAQRLVPASSSQRWEDTYEIAQPLSLFPGEPAWFAKDRNNGVAASPEFQAWVQWVKARPNLPIMASDGGSMPSSFRTWQGSWGHISPLMPLAASDCPQGMPACSYGDWYASRWGETAALSGAYGIMLSDFSDSQPHQLSTGQGFNPEIIASFERAENVAVPPGAILQRSEWIAANAISKWNDHLSNGYGMFYGALAQNLSEQTRHDSLVIDQCSLWPSVRRFSGTDERLLRNYVSPRNYLCEWDVQSMQVGRGGEDPALGVGAYAIAAAREPDMRNGANLEANDSAFWRAIASFNPTLDAAGQQEKGLKLLKRSWMEASWAHIATRQGQARRALSFMSRDYWDSGMLDPTLQGLITSIYPTAPFGFAVYYSTAAERAVEQQTALADPYSQAYYNPAKLLALKNAGVPVGYFVSDAALPALLPAAKPSAWIILEHPELIPEAEMQALESVAPVLTTLAQVQSLPGAPLAFTDGLTGTGFYDQNERLILTVTNPMDFNVTGLTTLQDLRDGRYTMLDLFTNNAQPFIVASGIGAVSLAVTRWDTRAFAVTRAGP